MVLLRLVFLCNEALSPGQFGKPAPVPFGGSSLATHGFYFFHFPLLGGFFPVGDAFGGLLVEKNGLGGGAALFGDAQDDDFPLHGAPADPDSGPCPDRPGGLCPLIIHLNLSPGDGLGCDAAGLEETGRPQPLVEPLFLPGRGIFRLWLVIRGVFTQWGILNDGLRGGGLGWFSGPSRIPRIRLCLCLGLLRAETKKGRELTHTPVFPGSCMQKSDQPP